MKDFKNSKRELLSISPALLPVIIDLDHVVKRALKNSNVLHWISIFQVSYLQIHAKLLGKVAIMHCFFLAVHRGKTTLTQD